MEQTSVAEEVICVKGVNTEQERRQEAYNIVPSALSRATLGISQCRLPLTKSAAGTESY